MHDPMSVAFEINSPFRNKKGDKRTLITIWHVDPCKDNTDDSCGIFMRARHCNQAKLKEVKSEFNFNLKHNYWFDKDGKQLFSTIATLLLMYRAALWIHFDRNRNKQDRFFRKYLADIIWFAENPTDCMGDSITNKWDDTTEGRFNGMASMIYSDICRKERKWYQHPKWHIHHWHIQFVFLRDLFSKKRHINNNQDDVLRATI